MSALSCRPRTLNSRKTMSMLPPTRLGLTQRRFRVAAGQFPLLLLLLTVPLALLLVRTFSRSAAAAKSTNTKTVAPDLARLSDRISVQTAGRGNPAINLSDGHEIVTAYEGSLELQEALKNNL